MSLASPILDLMSVRWVLSPAVALPHCRRVDEIPTSWMLEERMAVFERPTWLPRITTPKRLVICEGEEAVLDYISGPNFDPAVEAVIHNTYPLKGSMDQVEPSETPGIQQLKFEAEPPTWQLVSYKPTEIRLKLKSTGLSALRLADTWHPGWKATFDGEPVHILQSDYAFRLMLLPKGEGELKLHFEAREFGFGQAMALIGLSLVLAMVATRFFMRWKLKPTQEASEFG